ncbi:hypothetical protein MCHI_002433 [Candidatus Magnetoovum chiemensis]|nr:hypothetical protein MCHI_002433 [Candidatus Magnetoovum chiemensis]
MSVCACLTSWVVRMSKGILFSEMQLNCSWIRLKKKLANPLEIKATNTIIVNPIKIFAEIPKRNFMIFLLYHHPYTVIL